MSSVVGRGLGDIGVDAQLLVAKWLDLRSLCRLERVSKSMQRMARHKSIYAKLRRVTIQPSALSDHHSLSTNLPLLYTLHVGGLDLPALPEDADDGDAEPVGDGGEEPPKDPMELELAEWDLSVVVPALLRHVLVRGSRLASLEVLGKENLMAELWDLGDDLLQGIGEALAGKDVKLRSLAVAHVSVNSLTSLTAFTKPHLASLETLVIGPIAPIAPIALDFGLIAPHDTASARALLHGLGSPTLPALKHLFLSVEDGEGLEEWLGRLWGHLELFVCNLEDGPVEEVADELAELAKAAGSTLERREELYRVVLATEGLDESAVGEGELHSLDFLKDRAFLAAQTAADDISGGGFGYHMAMEQLAIDAGIDQDDFDVYDDDDDFGEAEDFY